MNAAPRVCLIQPPFVQLNGPYPAPYYLKPFLESRGCRVQVRDHSIGLFGRIFCRSGLEKIFADAETACLGGGGGRRGRAANKTRDQYIERFLSERNLWLSSIDRLAGFLRGSDREWGRLLCLANGTVPGGPRFDAFLERADGQVPAESGPLLASKLLSDLADFITAVLDPSFSLIRYVSSLSGQAGFRDFAGVEESLGGYIMETFYRPFLEDEWAALEGEGGEPFFLGLTIPFPGCLAGALVCARSARERFGPAVTIVAGGGYVNTELRFMNDPAFFKYADFLSFDRGYGSWAAILEQGAGEQPLYRTMYRSGKTGRIIRDPAIAGLETDGSAPTEPIPSPDFSRFRELEREAVQTVFPDYRDLDFSRYLYPVDDTNPMHRLWSAGPWLKAYMAHGCYWRRCMFCDTTLDYIRSFEPVDPAALFRHLAAQAEKTGVRGVHFVDEAAPSASLLRFAELNRMAALPLVFWGNIRFDRAFGPDEAALLAAGGLLGVSAGIEIATEAGCTRLDKGIGLKDMVSTCAAFKEAGILTHGYLIYGYWDEGEQEIVDSAEIIRQFFAQGLLDSAFWHKFILTRHSRLYGEWRRSSHPGLEVPGVKRSGSGQTPEAAAPCFAWNDLSFRGEKKSGKYTLGLDRLLAAWMSGDTSMPVEAAFPFKIPPPSVSPDTVALLLDGYARDRDRVAASLPQEPRKRLVFLGSRPLIQEDSGGAALFWRWRLGDRRLRPVPGKNAGETTETLHETAALLEKASLSPGLEALSLYRNLEALWGPLAKKAWKTLRQGGLVYSPGGTGPC